MWWAAVEPECVFVYGGWEEGGFVVDLLAGLEEGGADAFGLEVAGAVVEGVLAVEVGWCGCGCGLVLFLFCDGGGLDILRLKGECIDPVADLWREGGEEEA